MTNARTILPPPRPDLSPEAYPEPFTIEGAGELAAGDAQAEQDIARWLAGDDPFTTPSARAT